METCLESFHRFHKYLNFSHPKIKSNFDPDACGWAFGMNVFDLVRWRQEGVTARYHYWQEQNVDRTLWKLGTLPAGLLAFYGLTEPLDRRWHILGLGYDANIDAELIENGAVVHYNGNMKPWLKLAMSRYKPVWEKYVDYQNAYLQQCNFHWFMPCPNLIKAFPSYLPHYCAQKATRPILFHSWKYGFAFGKRFLAGCIECTFAVQTVVLPRLTIHFVLVFTLCSYCMCLAIQITEGYGWNLGQKPSSHTWCNWVQSALEVILDEGQ